MSEMGCNILMIKFDYSVSVTQISYNWKKELVHNCLNVLREDTKLKTTRQLEVIKIYNVFKRFNLNKFIIAYNESLMFQSIGDAQVDSCLCIDMMGI